jgi:uncharacterized protein YbaR (Trm112 family)
MNPMHPLGRSGSRVLDPELLKILRCPETRQELKAAPPAILDKINAQIAAGRARNRAGQTVSEKLTGGLIRADDKFLYPVLENIPVLLVDEAIPISE